MGEAKRARTQTLQAFCHQHNVRGGALITARIDRLKGAVALTTDAGVLMPALLASRTLVKELCPLLDTIAQYDAAIAKAFKTHPDAFIFASLSGAGPAFAPRLMAAFGSNRECFASVRALQEYLGIAAVTERSGRAH